MANLNGILDKVLSSNLSSSVLSGVAGGAAGSLLMSKKGRKLGKSALKIGGVAAVGALAYSAYKKYSDKQNNAHEHNANITQSSSTLSQPEALTQGNFDAHHASEDLETILVTAMVAASRADGQMDVKENQEIFKQIKSYDLSPDKQTALMELVEQPVNMDALVKAASSPEIAAEIYTISVLTVDDINEAERDYLDMLAMRLKLPNELVNAIENEVNQPVLVDVA